MSTYEGSLSRLIDVTKFHGRTTTESASNELILLYFSH